MTRSVRTTDAIGTGTADIVDTTRYPLDDPTDPRRRAVVGQARAELREWGCTVLREVIRSDRRDDLRDQGVTVAPQAHHDVAEVNAYNTDPDPGLPPDHPAHLTFPRRNAFVAHDRIPTEHLIHRLYASRSSARCWPTASSWARSTSSPTRTPD